jgi:hypothetical protein
MSRIFLFLIFINGPFVIFGNYLYCIPSRSTIELSSDDQDTLTRNQLLYNGRVWRNTYTGVRGDAYLFTKEFLNGSVTINGKSFDNISLLYEIHKDEVLTVSGRKIIILLNKEMVNSFNIEYNNRTYRFVNSADTPFELPDGYSNVLYEGNTGIYVKYRKVIDPRAVENRYDAFRQLQKMYVIVDSVAMPVNSKGQFFSLFSKEDAQALKSFVKREKLKITVKDPYSFIPVARYYDALNVSK